jgi:hypothetical protein
MQAAQPNHLGTDRVHDELQELTNQTSPHRNKMSEKGNTVMSNEAPVMVDEGKPTMLGDGKHVMPEKGTGYVYDAFCCCYDSIGFENIVVGCVGSSDVLCIRQNTCCAMGAKDRGLGMTTDAEKGECFKIGCYCCDWGLIAPTTLCRSTQQILCCNSTMSVPCHDDFVPKCMCASCFLQCAPKCGCCVKPPPNRAVKALMDRE